MENSLERQFPLVVGPEGRFFLPSNSTLKSQWEAESDEEPVPPIPKITEKVWEYLQELSLKSHEVVDNPRFYSKMFFI
jgi:hypothetical protein